MRRKKDIEALVAQSQKRSAVYDIVTEPDQRHGRRRVGELIGSGTAIERVTTVVIGAGHAGLATSRCLSERSIDHVVLERGEVANSWRRERWDSLRLLTPNWQSRLPGYRYEGADPDGFMTMAEVIEFVSRFAAVVGRAGARTPTVTSVSTRRRGLSRRHRSRRLSLPHPSCLASGALQRRERAGGSAGGAVVDRAASQRSIIEIRISFPTAACSSSARLATGVQLADEIRRSGRGR